MRRYIVCYILIALISTIMLIKTIFLIVNLVYSFRYVKSSPLVITTWKFFEANDNAWHKVYYEGSSSVDAVEVGCSVCEKLQCDLTVGYGGSPDENSETTLDALIMDGTSMNVGAVADLRRVKSAASVARHILDYTKHSILAGDQATQFAVQMKFKEEVLTTNVSKQIWRTWRQQNCQPNFWTNVFPNPEKYCGPYKPSKMIEANQHINSRHFQFDNKNHDTIGIIVIDKNNNIAAGTSTNGARHKIPGRVGDSPIPGAGAYADSDVGGAAATGDGDIMLRFLPSYLAVEEMRRGANPSTAASVAIERIKNKYPNFFGAIIAVNKAGVFGAACSGMKEFPFSLANVETQATVLKTVSCV